MDCSCDWGDPPDFYRAKAQTARKTYRCYDCNGEIRPGERYEYAACLWREYGDGVDVYRTCERCYDIRVWLKNSVPCFCYAHGGLEETAEEAVEDARQRAPEEAVGLWFGLQRRLKRRRKFNEARRAS